MTTAGFSTAAHGLGETGVTRPISDTADIGLTYPASLVRSAWESRYVNTLMLIDIHQEGFRLFETDLCPCATSSSVYAFNRPHTRVEQMHFQGVRSPLDR